jgi:hypothetical protein
MVTKLSTAATLSLLTIQAMKDLEAETDARKAENNTLKLRVADLERLVNELLATAVRR